jgi:hypothetical protein
MRGDWRVMALPRDEPDLGDLGGAVMLARVMSVIVGEWEGAVMIRG